MISVYNNGRGIPIKIHKNLNVRMPEMLLRQLMISFIPDLKRFGMTDLTRLIYHPDDDVLLDYLNEAMWYVPIIPMVLVNGAEGIGTGWRTSIPKFNPTDIIQNLKRKIVIERYHV